MERVEGIDVDDSRAVDPFLEAGLRCTDLVVDPSNWINRRVETVEMLSYEETRRRVSVDFTLPPDSGEDGNLPQLDGGVVVPISVLSKAPRRHFDLRDESGASVPVLGMEDNSLLAHTALLGMAIDAVEDEKADIAEIQYDLWRVVAEPPDAAELYAEDFSLAWLKMAASGRF